MIKLINDYVLVEVSMESSGSVVDFGDDPTTGQIVAHSNAPCNEDSIRIMSCLAIGDYVRFRAGLKPNFKFAGKDFILCKVHDIIGVVEQEGR